VKNRLQKALAYGRALVGYSVVLVLGRVFGLPVVIRYLRNPDPLVTVRLIRSFGGRVGNRTKFKRAVMIDNAYEDRNSTGDLGHLTVGHNCYIGDLVYFDLANEVVIGDNAVVAGSVSFVTHADCNRSEYLAVRFPRTCAPIKVGNGAWLGFGSTILGGVTIGDRSVLAAGSLLARDVEPEHLYAGIPAEKVRKIE
jgi:acetyltransferase-like isoleucine patch superfamily enzyme